ncbi:carbohydrate ABC transporter permease [Saccharospirillum salsuginis]|uniref:ABC transporter permease n=1 Tax=Saccharospirillum salsuginis TaxID=418750 RepID=A0A918K5F8_9GAMM|nr:sugar ABC transporter permease [Saccharospirillum salsuginis]GGX49132.1 ABC transporter permease [Saccharospirillum salsuginis]
MTALNHSAPAPVNAERRTLSDLAQRRIIIVCFLVLPVGLLTVFSFYPAARLVYLSFMDWDGFSPVMDFVGFANYVEILYWDPELLAPLLNSFYYFFGSLIQLGLALWFAIILNQKLPGGDLFKVLLFLPFVLNQVASAFVFRVFFQVDGGLDSFLSLIGLDALSQPWLMDKDVVPWSLVGASVWRYLGFNLVVFYGALQSIPSDLYEAATIDGANEWQKFRFITLPAIKLMIMLQALLALVGSLEVFEIPLLITGGANGTKTFVMATVEQAFQFQSYGIASAMAVLLLIMVFAFLLVQRTVSQEKAL